MAATGVLEHRRQCVEKTLHPFGKIVVRIPHWRKHYAPSLRKNPSGATTSLRSS
jgi:hypothetical protein